MTTCLRCQKELSNRQKIYCSNLCQITYQYESFIQSWKEECVSGKSTLVTKNISKHLKRYLTELHGERCSECGWNKRNVITQKVPLEVDHIDGNSENNHIKNLRLLCPNCHALTPHFRNLNKGNGRRWRVKKWIGSHLYAPHVVWPRSGVGTSGKRKDGMFWDDGEPSVCSTYTMASLGHWGSQAGPGMDYKKYLKES